jgi:hypothetical protein
MGDRNEFRSTGRAPGSAQAMGRRKSSPKFISARVWTGDGQAQEFAEIHFGTGLDRRWAGARVRRNSFRHGSGQAMGDRNEFRSTGRAPGSAQAMGRRKSSPKFISARVGAGDGQAQEFAEIHFGMGLGRRWATEMNVAQPAGRRGLGRRWAAARVRRNSFRHGSGQAMGERNECRSTGRAPGSGQAMGDRNECRSTGRAPGSGQAMGDRNECRSTGRAPGSGQAMGSRKSSPTFISAWVWAGDGRPK